MYRYLVVPLLFVAFSYQASAQVKLRSELEFTSFIQYEPITIKATIRNDLGQPSVFNVDENDPRFYYLVKDENGYIISPRPNVEQPHPVMITPRSSETITNNILKYFAISTPGYYSVQPCVDWRGKAYRGEKKQFEVLAGREIDRATGVVPGDAAMRLYRLYHINRNLQDHLLLRIDDEEAHLCYGVFPLGRMIINSKPELAVDREAKVHVVFRVSPNTHVYATYSPMGYLLNQEVFGEKYAEVKLRSRPDGSIYVNTSIESRRGTTVPDIKSIIDKNKMRRE